MEDAVDGLEVKHWRRQKWLWVGGRKHCEGEWLEHPVLLEKFIAEAVSETEAEGLWVWGQQRVTADTLVSPAEIKTLMGVFSLDADDATVERILFRAGLAFRKGGHRPLPPFAVLSL